MCLSILLCLRPVLLPSRLIAPIDHASTVCGACLLADYVACVMLYDTPEPLDMDYTFAVEADEGFAFVIGTSTQTVTFPAYVSSAGYCCLKRKGKKGWGGGA